MPMRTITPKSAPARKVVASHKRTPPTTTMATIRLDIYKEAETDAGSDAYILFPKVAAMLWRK